MRPKDFSKFPEDSVRHLLEKKRADLRDYTEMAREAREYIADLEADLERRKLDRYWEAHPGLRLEVGDKLLVTQHSVEWFEEGMQQVTYPVGWVLVVDNFELLNLSMETPWAAEKIGILPFERDAQGDIFSIPLVRQMRQAYLDKEKI